MARLHPFPQHFEASSTTPSTGEAVAPWWVFPGQLSPLACELEEAKGEEARERTLGLPGELSL